MMYHPCKLNVWLNSYHSKIDYLMKLTLKRIKEYMCYILIISNIKKTDTNT